ncbi:MAG: hypothetical protein SV062_00735 [Thermodesulfobacteriota bacterium]|nr:hypothetical protein [Thermodesulfobacteriota bacterium]
MDSRKIILTPASNVLAHAGRCVIVARELKRRGHNVILAGSPKYLQSPEVVKEGEFEFYNLPDIGVEESLEILRTFWKKPKRSSVKEHLDAELEMYKVLKPHLIIADFRLTVYISARKAGIPVVSLLGGRWIEKYAVEKLKAIKTHPKYPTIKKILGIKGAEIIMPFFQRLIIRYKVRPFQFAFKKYGLKKKKTLGDLLTGDFNLILDTHLWCPTRDLPENFQVVGPVYWEPEIPMPDWIKKIDRTRPVIYITLGSTGHKDIFYELFKVFTDSSYQILVSTGGQIDIPRDRVPKNFFLEKYLPGEEIMKLSDMVIYHGGSGTSYQTIKTCTPAIVIATHLEQEFMGEALEIHQVGIFLTMIDVIKNPSLTLEATRKIFANLAMYRANMEKLKEDLERYNPLLMVADVIENFLGIKMSPGL